MAARQACLDRRLPVDADAWNAAGRAKGAKQDPPEKLLMLAVLPVDDAGKLCMANCSVLPQLNEGLTRA